MKIGLVLCGGMAKGAYQIGALKAINQFIPFGEIKYISCASVGVLNGYAFATNNLDRAEQMWKTCCDNGSRFLISQMLKSTLLQQNIASLYDPEKPLEHPFYTSLMDINRANVVYKDLSAVPEEKVARYLRASVAMPIYNRAVTVEGTAYYDGAMIDNIPIYPLLEHDLDYILCIYFDDICYKFENGRVDKKVIKISFPSETLLRQSVLFEQESIDRMIKSGYDRTMHILKSVFFEGYDNLDYIYDSIAYMNRTSPNSRLRITGDVLVTNLNKVTQRLIKRKIL